MKRVTVAVISLHGIVACEESRGEERTEGEEGREEM